MEEIGAFEAKTHLSQLLERAHNGESFLLTRNGQPMAELTPLTETDEEARKSAVARIRSLRKEITSAGPVLEKGEDWRSLAHEDHKW